MIRYIKEYLSDPSDFVNGRDIALGYTGMALILASEIPGRREEHVKAFKIFCVGAACVAPVAYRALTLESSDQARD